MMKSTNCLLFLFIFALCAQVQASPRFAGPVRYDFNPQMTSVTLDAVLIKNDSHENASGTLKLQLWASAAPYIIGTISGHLLASTDKIDGLGPGQYYENFHRTVAYSPPTASGTYYLTFLLLEYKGGAYVIVNHVNIAAPKALGPLQLFSMEAPWRWQTSKEGGTIDISVAKISHRRTGATGTLKLSVWLTDQPYRGGRLVGYEIGQVRKDPLQVGYTYSNVQNTAKFTPPPAGTYYPTLVLSESDGSQFNTVAYLNSASPASFGPPR